MRTPKRLYADERIIYHPELLNCLHCGDDLTYRIFKRHFSAVPSGAQAPKTPLGYPSAPATGCRSLAAIAAAPDSSGSLPQQRASRCGAAKRGLDMQTRMSEAEA